MLSSIAGGVVGAEGAQKQGQAQLLQNYYQAGIAQFNAQIARQNADWAVNQGEVQAQTYGIQAGQTLGHIITAQAGSGFDVGSGTAAAVQASQRKTFALDLEQIRANANQAAFGYNVQAVNFDKQAQLYQMAGTNAAAAGQISAESSILGTVGSVASKWTQASQVGLFGDFGSLASGDMGAMPATGPGSPSNLASSFYAITQGISPGSAFG
jgi:hypothetical protein